MPARIDHDVPLAGLVDDLREVVFHLCNGEPPQAVVAAERDDENPDVSLERPVEPPQAAGRRVA